MTGNNKFWRASLAGLASVAMLATMGVAASTANAVEGTSGLVKAGNYFTLQVYRADQPYGDPEQWVGQQYGEVVNLAAVADPYKADKTDHKKLAYFSYDQAGKNKVNSNYPVTGDVKLFAQYEDAVTVGFDTDNDGTADKSVEIAKGSSLTAADYVDALDTDGDDIANEPASGSFPDVVFVGWTYTNTVSGSTDDLYTNQAISSDTVLHARRDKGQNVATLAFREFGQSATKYTYYTLNGHEFPEYRAPQALDWNYDFTKTVANSVKNNTDYSVDTTVVSKDVNAALNNYTVNVNLNGAPADNDTFGTKETSIKTTKDGKLTKPADPAWEGHVFTGWYTAPASNGESVAYDFSKTVQENYNKAQGVVTLYAGWDGTNVAGLQFNLKYAAANQSRIVWYVYAGSKVTLPAGLEEYYQTAAQVDANKGEYTAAKLTGWKYGPDTVTEATAPAKGYSATFDAVWSTDASYRLDANGGKFGTDTTKWVTGSTDFPTPTREGYRFVGWIYDGNLDPAKVHTTSSDVVLNAANKKFYVFDWNAEGYFGADAGFSLTAGDFLKAQWAAVSVEVTEADYTFNGTLGYTNKASDVAKVTAAGYTADSAAKFVDAMWAASGDYKNYLDSKDGSQNQIDLATKLAKTYADAKALLVKSDVPVQPEVEKVAVYRLYNPGLAQVAQHLYTTNVDEYNRLQQSEGWKGEGIVFYTTSDKTAAPVYRLYNQYTSEHFLTSDKAEYEDLYQNKGWTNEGVAWYIPSDGTADLFRLQNPVSFEHLYTTNAAEKDNLTANAGWVLEGAPYKVYAK